MNDLNQAKDWLKKQQVTLDAIIAEAAREFHVNNRSRTNYVHDLNTCNEESFRLVKGGDLCYDRYTMGLSYSTWYHARRVNTLIYPVLNMLYNNSGDRETIDIYDLGAGTGAVLWALSLAKIAIEATGKKVPKMHVRMLDASPFMLDYAKRYLMPAFYKRYPSSKETTVELTVNSWVNETEQGLTTPWIFASYLFDHNENHQQIEETFRELIEDVEPEIIVLSTSKQRTKNAYLSTAVENIKELDYLESNHGGDLLFEGNLINTYNTRKSIQQWADVGFRNKPSWDRDKTTFQTVTLTKKNIGLALREKITKRERLSMYQSPIVVRRELILNKEQKKASIPNGRPTIIRGPAGCGKSVIITERIKNLFEESNYDPSIRILLTTFNKELIWQLYTWMKDLVGDKMKFSKSNNRTPHYEGKILGSNYPNLIIMHFDILPTRLTNSNFKRNEYKNVLHQMAASLTLDVVIDEYINEKNIQPSRYDHILDSRFIHDEYVRVVYGLQNFSETQYLKADREGRGMRLNKNGNSRKIVWDIIIRFLDKLKKDENDTFTTIRHKYFKSLRANRENSGYLNYFEHLFVDEFQDCTQTDYELFYRLVKNPNNFVIAGDYAQAVHLGYSSDIPRQEEMGNFDHKDIKGSYRLPMWVSHGVKPLTEHMKAKNSESSLIQPYKGAPPGARIMLVHASNSEEMALKIIDIIDTYSIYSLEEWHKFQEKSAKGVAVLEKDSDLCYYINTKSSSDIKAQSDTILRIKGREKKCVIWSTREAIEDEEEIYHYVYTILSRTAGLCIIALFDEMKPEFKKVVNMLNKDFISTWDKNTEKFFVDEIVNNKETERERPVG